LNTFDLLLSRIPLSWVKAVSRLQWRGALFRRGFEVLANRFRNRDSSILRGVGKGLRFNAGDSSPGYLLGTAQPLVQTALARFVRPGMCVYDVGANVGFFSVLAARLTGPAGRVIAFEPLASNARQIEHNAGLNGFGHISVRQQALGILDGEALFRVSERCSWGKLAHVGGVAREVGTITVSVQRLDTVLLDGGGARPPDVVKIDVEGAEVEVLQGAGETLRRCRPLLLVELHGTNRAVADLLSEAAYEMVVLGSAARPEDASWEAQIVCVPRENRELLALATGL
jgi:FkbM family methyltransferase